MKTKVVIGIDIGLTGMKAIAFDLKGNITASQSATSPHDMPKPHWSEREGEDFWAAVCKMLRHLMGKLENYEIIGVGCSAHGDGIWILDENNRPLRPGILSLDTRAFETSLKYSKKLEKLLLTTGQGASPSSPATLLAWLKENEPETLAKAKSFMWAKDFIRYRLSRTVGTDLTEASTSFFNYKKQEWDPKAFELYDLSELEKIAPIVNNPTDIVGSIGYDTHIHTGLPEGIPVVAGLHDVDAGAIGAGATHPGQLAVMAGTYSINEVISAQPKVSKDWFCRSFIRKGLWMNMAISPASSSNLEWFVQTLCQQELDIAKRAGIDPYGFVDKEISEVADDPSDIVFFPFLYGNPLDVDADSCFMGMRAWHNRGHLLKAIYEGIAFNHKYHIDPLIENFQVDEIRVVGGVTRSSIWPKMLASVLDRQILIPEVSEGGALGTAMIVAVGIGQFKDLDEAAKTMGSKSIAIDPDPKIKEMIIPAYEKYKEYMKQIYPLWKNK